MSTSTTFKQAIGSTVFKLHLASDIFMAFWDLFVNVPEMRLLPCFLVFQECDCIKGSVMFTQIWYPNLLRFFSQPSLCLNLD